MKLATFQQIGKSLRSLNVGHVVSRLGWLTEPGFLRISQDFSGFLRISQDFSGFLRISQDFSGFPKISQDFSRFPKISQDFSDFTGFLGVGK
jgi:hypothetical protein